MNEETLRSLLRQRAGGEMPSGYEHTLLHNLRQRQRSEMLRRSLWQIASDRMAAFWSEHSTSTAAYSLAMAALVTAGCGVIFFLKPRISGDYPGGTAVELARTGEPPAKFKASTPHQAASSEGNSSLETQQVSFGK